jgi:hypothetical protein
LAKVTRHALPGIQPELQQLFKLSGDGVDLGTWLAGAESSIEFLEDNARAERVVIYATLKHVLVEGVLAPLKQLKNPDQSELGGGFPSSGAGCYIEHASGGGRPDRVYLATPLDDSPTLKGGEQLVFRRSWPVAPRASTEISQRLVHALRLHFVDYRNAYCRVDEVGEIEDIINIVDISSETFAESIFVVTIKAHEFFEYARLAKMGVVFFYDFTRFQPGSFNGWSNPHAFQRSDPHLFYHGGVQRGIGSYVNGRQIVIPPVTRAEIVRRYKERRAPKKRLYATFKAQNLKTGERIEVSCDPTKLSNYFQPESQLPLEMSPAFFRAEVLHKYKADPSKYELQSRDIGCRGAWRLRAYDVNDAGQVHTYLRYLADLPYQEQIYWQSFNEWPKGFISERALRTDFMGEWRADYDPLREILRKTERLDKMSPNWWKARGSEIARSVHLPVTGSESEWADAILALDQLVIEGVQEKPLKKAALEMGRVLENEWRSLKLLEECLVGKGAPPEEAKEAISSLRAVRDLRTIVKGHAAPEKKALAIKDARTRYGSLRAHFEAVAAACDEGLGFVMARMDTGSK